MMNRTSGTPAAAQQPAEGSNGEGEANGATTEYYRAFVPKVTSKFSFNIS
jgi:hypothetical protein